MQDLPARQVVLDRMGFELLSDFLHIVAYNTSDPFANLPLGGASVASAMPGARKSGAKYKAQTAGHRDQKQALDENVKATPPLTSHVWKACYGPM